MRSRLARAGILILILLYGAALFANFLAPYSPEAEFREYFFHPPSSIYFRNESGKFVAPYVLQTHLADPQKHHFQEGSVLRIGTMIPEENKSPYVPEWLEDEAPFALIYGENEEILAGISTARETAENSGFFVGQTTVVPNRIGKRFVVKSRGKIATFALRNREYATEKESSILVVDADNKPLTEFKPSMEKYRLHFFVRGSSYKFLGLFRTNLHFFGVEPPGHLFLFGTDQSGRDIFSRILFGARISLTAGLIAVFISTLLGLWIGGTAGYFGGKADSILMRGTDLLLSIPALYFILAVRNVFPTDLVPQITYLLVIVVLSMTGWAGMSRVIRGMVLSLREQEFVLAARALGASSTRILIRHILPNTMGYVIARATILIPAYILAEITLSYLGFGIQEPAASWGNMLSAAQEMRVLEQFWWILTPGVFLFLAVLGFHFVGDGLTSVVISDE
jgi:peptide/nickel transport system permease protein